MSALLEAVAVVDEADLARGADAAARAAALGADPDETAMALLRQSADAFVNVTALTGAVLELRERLFSDQLGDEARYDLAEDIIELTHRLQGFALAVRA